nr:hypothetical protein [Tanacetum cinerariifolium]
MHNNIMAASLKDHPPMLRTRRYTQWQSRFLRYIDTRPNGDALRKCILEVETILNMSPENKAHFESEKEVIYLILTGIGDEIYSTVDACKTAHEMWEAIERLQQGESLNIQDVKTNLFWEFGKFTSHDGETMKSYYTRFYKMMNEMIRNSLTVATMQVNVQFLQQLQPEWLRSHATTRNKGREIAKPITPLSKSAYEEDSDPKQAQRDKDMQKKLELIAKYFKNIYKPTNNYLRTSSNSKNKNLDTNLRAICWLADMDEEIDEQELEAHYSYMEKDLGKCDDEYVALANLKLDVDENKKIQKTLRESNSIRDSCLVALQKKQTEFERYNTLNDRIVDSKKLKHKLNETLGLLAQKDNDIKEGLKLKAYEISIVQEKYDELVKQSLLTKTHYEGLVKEKTKVIMDVDPNFN